MRHRARDGFDDREDMVNVTMKNEGGLCMGIVGTQSVKRGMVTIGPNVRDLDGAMVLLEDHGSMVGAGHRLGRGRLWGGGVST